MAITRRARYTAAVNSALTKVGVVPTAERLSRWPVERRALTRPGRMLTGPVRSDVSSTDHPVPGRHGASVRLRSYTVEGRHDAVPGLLYMHGGGWITGGLDSCDHICRRLAADTGAVVASVEYRLAPENPYPAALHDCLDALAWFVDNAAQFGFDPQRTVVAGDSAGGNLAAAVVLAAVEQLTFAPAGQLLIYPCLDHTRSTPSAQNYSGPGLSAAEATACSQLYLATADALDPLASPLLSPDLSGLPPTLIVTAGYDCLRDEGIAYHNRLRAADCSSRLLDCPDYMHGFLSTPRLYNDVDVVWQQLAQFLTEVRPAQV
ncbi:alpha/beta hydrolase [Actinoplanes sp. LDG1-06]|uniref:Alpha/beta hydrolase n=1 Tax=Paractinoplanes ovalisporus TaxID=2810368 RepID=A0ABS2AVP0_9ACTN|nr:alpha/beta hydrolase [Actinoplanes ovalisporus]MBM2623896.1 alpha/beta hydrolase [Actinoplanes ovalisporus]